MAKFFATVRPQGTLIAGRNLHFLIEFFAEETLTAPVSSVDLAAQFNIAAANVWADYAADIEIPAGANFARVIAYKESTSNAYGFDLAGVYLEPSVPLASGFELPALAGISHVRAKTATAGSYANGAVIQYATEDQDTLNEYNTGTWTFTATKAGTYAVSAALFCDFLAYNSGNSVQISIHRNGSHFAFGARTFAPSTASWYLTSSVATTVVLAVGDTVSVVVSHDRAGGNVTLFPDAAGNYFSVDRLL